MLLPKKVFLFMTRIITYILFVLIFTYAVTNKGPWKTAEKGNAPFVTQIKQEINNWSFLLSCNTS